MKPKALSLVIFAAGVGASFAIAGPPAKVALCHLTGSKTHPYVLLHVSTHAQKAHLAHGDVAPDTTGSCPATAPAGGKPPGGDEGTATSPTGTGSTTTTTTGS